MPTANPTPPNGPRRGASPARSDFDDEFDDDGVEYEVEPPDAAIEESRRRRAAEAVTRAQTSVEIDELDAQADDAGGLDDLVSGFRLRFSTKHLLIATAGLAVLLSLGQLMGSHIAALFVAVLVLLVATHVYIGWRDKRRQEELAERRRRLVELARLRDHAANDADVAARQAACDELDAEQAALERAARPPELRLAFSTKHLLITMTAAAVLLGVLSWVTPGLLAGVLGLVAIAGLLVFVTGVEAPPPAVMAWWVVVSLYIVVSLVGMAMPDGLRGP